MCREYYYKGCKIKEHPNDMLEVIGKHGGYRYYRHRKLDTFTYFGDEDNLPLSTDVERFIRHVKESIGLYERLK